MPRHPSEFMRATVLEVDSRAHDEVLHGARHEHLARLGTVHHARRDVHSQ
jgi:hypothetical protein